MLQERLLDSIRNNRVPHAILISGPEGSGRRELARRAAALYCLGEDAPQHLVNNPNYLEMADSRRLVLITTPNDEPSWYDRLMDALAALPNRKAPKQKKQQNHCAVISGGERKMSIREAVFAPKDSVPLSQAEGRVASEALGVYPPGIARVLPGERIDDKAMNDLLTEERNGGALFGVRDGRVFVVRQEKV